ncbi:MAG: ParB/RepB/Spo0J family partition protein [Bacteroidota bacterium]
MAKKVRKVASKTRSSREDLRKSINRTGITGGGLGAFFSGADTTNNKEEVVKQLSNTVAFLPIGHIYPNADQPRVDFDQEALEELADSIRNLGIIQPITVRHISDEEYQIISGERRWRAAKIAALQEIPTFIRIADDREIMEMALVENIQREDLNPWEVANTYQRLMEEFDLTQEKVSERVGKKRATVANYLGLLKIDNDAIKKALKESQISMGHGRELAVIKDAFYQNLIFKNIVKDGLSVRATERLAKLYKENSAQFDGIHTNLFNPKLKNALQLGEVSFEQVLELIKVDIYPYQDVLLERIDDGELSLKELSDWTDFYVTHRSALEVSAKNFANIKAFRREELTREHLRAIGRLSDQGQQDQVRVQVIKKVLNPEQTDRLVDSFLGLETTSKKSHPVLDAHYDKTQQLFRASLGNKKIRIKLKEDGTGQVIIPFDKGEDTLNQLIDLIEFAKANDFDKRN